MDERIALELSKRIADIDQKLDNYEKSLARMINERLAAGSITNEEAQVLLDDMAIKKIELNIQKQEYMDILTEGANFNIQSKNQLVQIRFHERIYSQIENLENMLATPGIDDDTKKRIEEQIDTLLYQRGLDFKEPKTDKEKDKMRVENADKLAKKIENLYVGMNSIYGNINEEIFDEDISTLRGYQEKLERRKAIGGMAEIKSKLSDYKSIESQINQLNEQLAANNGELSKKMKELEEKKKKLEEQKNTLSKMGNPQKEYDAIIAKTPVDNKALMKAKDKLDKFNALKADNIAIEADIASLETDLAGIFSLRDAIQSLFESLGIKDEKGNNYKFDVKKSSEALETAHKSKIDNGLDNTYMRNQKTLANDIMQKYGITVPNRLPKNYNFVDELKNQRDAIEARKRSSRIQPGWEDVATKGMSMKGTDPKASSKADSKADPKVTPKVDPKAAPKSAPASTPTPSKTSAPFSPATPAKPTAGVAHDMPADSGTSREGAAGTSTIPYTYVPIHTSDEVEEAGENVLPKRGTTIIDRAESSVRNMAEYIADPDSRKIEGGFVYRVMDDGTNVAKVKEDLEYYLDGTDRKLEDVIKDISNSVRDLSSKDRRDLLASLNKQDDAYKMLASRNPITRYTARKNFISDLNDSPARNVEMLLALKSSVIPEEQIRCLEKTKGNIYEYGSSDLKKAIRYKERNGLFGKKYEYKLNSDNYKDADDNKNTNSELDKLLEEYRNSAKVKTRDIRKGPSKSSKGKDGRDSR